VRPSQSKEAVVTVWQTERTTAGPIFKILLGAVGVAVLYYSQVGRGQENDAALLPNSIEDRIDLVVAALNEHFGKQWVNWGLDALRYYIQETLPAPLVTIVGVIVTVEKMSRRSQMSSNLKRQTAAQMLRQR
jgi:hypothetical protein